MSHIQISFLGRAAKKSGQSDNFLGYEPTAYRFEEGKTFTSTFFGESLQQYINPDKLVIFGTSGSMWDALFEGVGAFNPEEEKILEDILFGTEEKSTTQELLARASPLLAKKYKLEPNNIVLTLFPDQIEELTNVKILQEIAEHVQDNDLVSLDITHGYRFLPMLAFVASLFLQNVKKAKIQGIYYGALEMKKNGAAPVLDLKNLLTVTDWIAALSAYEKSGDFGLFAPLYKSEGVNEHAMEYLKNAAFLERTNCPEQAKTYLGRYFSQVPNLTTPIGGLFKEELEKRLSWAKSPERFVWELKLAKEYLQRKDYLRACLMLLEGCVTKEIAENPSKYQHDPQNDSRKIALDNLKRTGGDFSNLNSIRNILSHGERRRNKKASDIVKDENRLNSFLEQFIASM